MDEVWGLGVSEEESLRRLMRRGFDKEDAKLRIDSQLSLDERQKRCHFFIDTFNVSREENSKRMIKRLNEIEEYVSLRNEGKPLLPFPVYDCNPVDCNCKYLSMSKVDEL